MRTGRDLLEGRFEKEGGGYPTSPRGPVARVTPTARGYTRTGSRSVAFRLTLKDYAVLEALAKRQGRKPADIARATLLKVLETEDQPQVAGLEDSRGLEGGLRATLGTPPPRRPYLGARPESLPPKGGET